MITYQALMDGVREPITANTLEDAIEQTDRWAREGDWDTSNGTIWVHAWLIEIDDDGEETSHRVTVTIDPQEPQCTGEEHYWESPHEIVGGIKENPGVWGHGGGVTIQEVCVRCGCGKLTDTWAQDPDTGQQGLNSVRYEKGKYAKQINQ